MANLRPSEQIVLDAVMGYDDQHATSRAMVSTRTGFSLTTCGRHLATLLKAGLVERAWGYRMPDGTGWVYWRTRKRPGPGMLLGGYEL